MSVWVVEMDLKLTFDVEFFGCDRLSNLELLKVLESLLKICHSSCLKPGSLTVGKS